MEGPATPTSPARVAVRSAAVYASLWLLAVGFAAVAGLLMARSDGTNLADLVIGLLVGLVVFGAVAAFTLIAAHVLWLVSVQRAIEPRVAAPLAQVGAVVTTAVASVGALYVALRGASRPVLGLLAVGVLGVLPALLGWGLAASARPGRTAP